MKKDTSWGTVANWYADYLIDPDNYQSQVIAPNLKRILELKEGTTVLDLACGSGFFSELFHREGAVVTGADISKELIDIAKKNASKDIRFLVTSAHRLRDVESGSIEKIVIILAIQNIKEVKEMFDECRRVLTPQGTLSIVMNHPSFRVPGGSSWEWAPPTPKASEGRGEKTGRMYRRIDQYMSEKTVEISMHPGKNPGKKTVSFHRPLQYYVKLARNAGFSITRLEEWISHKASQRGPRQKEEDRIRKEIPLFLFLELSV